MGNSAGFREDLAVIEIQRGGTIKDDQREVRVRQRFQRSDHADAFDAMTTQRPYNQVISVDEAMEHLSAGVGVYWDARIVAVFVCTKAPPLEMRTLHGSDS